MIESVYLGLNLVLSAKIPYRALCEGFFVSSVSKNVTKTAFRGLLTGVWRFTSVKTLEKCTPTIAPDAQPL